MRRLLTTCVRQMIETSSSCDEQRFHTHYALYIIIVSIYNVISSHVIYSVRPQDYNLHHSSCSVHMNHYYYYCHYLRFYRSTSLKRKRNKQKQKLCEKHSSHSGVFVLLNFFHTFHVAPQLMRRSLCLPLMGWVVTLLPILRRTQPFPQPKSTRWMFKQRQ